MSMTPNNILSFSAPPSPRRGHRMRPRPADVIPLSAHHRSHERFDTSVLFAVAALLVWGGAIVLGLVDVRLHHGWTNDLFPGWQGWPIW
jgi:hypothetical protein